MYHFSSLDDVAIDSVLNSQDPIHVDSDDSGFGSVQRNSTLSGVRLHTFCCAQQGLPTKVNNLDNNTNLRCVCLICDSLLIINSSITVLLLNKQTDVVVVCQNLHLISFSIHVFLLFCNHLF